MRDTPPPLPGERWFRLLLRLYPAEFRARVGAEMVEFYRDRLGFRITQSWEPDGVLAWCRLERDGVALMLQSSCEEDGPAAGRGRGATFYFNCDDAAAIHHELTAAGLQLPPPERAFYGMDQVYLVDPDGYQVCFQSVCGA